jgi:hypothetical protein
MTETALLKSDAPSTAQAGSKPENTGQAEQAEKNFQTAGQTQLTQNKKAENAEETTLAGDVFKNAPERAWDATTGFLRQFVYENVGEIAISVAQGALLSNDPGNEFGFDAMPQTSTTGEVTRREAVKQFGAQSREVKDDYLDDTTRFYGGDPDSLSNKIGRVTAGITDLAVAGKGLLSGGKAIWNALKATEAFQDAASQAKMANTFAKQVAPDDLARWINGDPAVDGPAFANVAEDLTSGMVRAMKQNLQQVADNAQIQQALKALDNLNGGPVNLADAHVSGPTLDTPARGLTPEEFAQSDNLDAVFEQLQQWGGDIAELLNLTTGSNGVKAPSLRNITLNPEGFDTSVFQGAEGQKDLISRIILPDPRTPHPLGKNGIPALTPDELSEPTPVRGMADPTDELIVRKATAIEYYNEFIGLYGAKIKIMEKSANEITNATTQNEINEHTNIFYNAYDELLSQMTFLQPYIKFLPEEAKNTANQYISKIDSLEESLPDLQ